MTKYVVDASVVLHLRRQGIEVSSNHQLLAPTLLRSEILEALCRKVRGGELAQEAGLDRIARFVTMKIRYLGDKVLRRRAWSIDQLVWESTQVAEYVALTQLQADAFVTLDAALGAEVERLVETAGIDSLS